MTNSQRKNGKAFKKNPGPAQPPKTNFTHVNGRSAESHALRESWKAIGGRADNSNIPHWNYIRKEIPHWKTGVTNNV